MHTVLKERLHQRWTQWDNSLFDRLVVLCLMLPRMQFALWARETLMAPTEPAVDQHPQIPFCNLLSSYSFSQFTLVPGVTTSQVQNPFFGLVKFHATDDCSMLPSILVGDWSLMLPIPLVHLIIPAYVKHFPVVPTKCADIFRLFLHFHFSSALQHNSSTCRF